ncbi:MAG: hypothetical protein LC772_07105 [Chloroflexi bacterium]|nr:hypothetical protein [Chloroflexota bacterium]
MSDLPSRRKRYYSLGSRIAGLDSARLQSMLENNEPITGWGRNHTVEVGKSKVFVKRLPVTDIEYENFFSTRNLYDLPGTNLCCSWSTFLT